MSARPDDDVFAESERRSWVQRCVSCLQQLEDSVDWGEAMALAQAMWSLPRYRGKSPAEAAKVILCNRTIRPTNPTTDPPLLRRRRTRLVR